MAWQIFVCTSFYHENYSNRGGRRTEPDMFLKKNSDTENTRMYYVCYFYEVRNDYSKFKIDHYK